MVDVAVVLVGCVVVVTLVCERLYKARTAKQPKIVTDGTPTVTPTLIAMTLP